jgi:hypothetical protein
MQSMRMLCAGIECRSLCGMDGVRCAPGELELTSRDDLRLLHSLRVKLNELKSPNFPYENELDLMLKSDRSCAAHSS